MSPPFFAAITGPFSFGVQSARCYTPSIAGLTYRFLQTLYFMASLTAPCGLAVLSGLLTVRVNMPLDLSSTSLGHSIAVVD